MYTITDEAILMMVLIVRDSTEIVRMRTSRCGSSERGDDTGRGQAVFNYMSTLKHYQVCLNCGLPYQVVSSARAPYGYFSSIHSSTLRATMH